MRVFCRDWRSEWRSAELGTCVEVLMRRCNGAFGGVSVLGYDRVVRALLFG